MTSLDASVRPPRPPSGSVVLLEHASRLRVSFHRVAGALADCAEDSADRALVRRVEVLADKVRAELLGRPGGFCEAVPVVVGYRQSGPQDLVVEWVPGDYAVTLAQNRLSEAGVGLDLGAQLAGSASAGTRRVRSVVGGPIGLNVTVLTADGSTVVAVRSPALRNGGLAYVPANEGLTLTEVSPLPVDGGEGPQPFRPVVAVERALREELGLVDLGIGPGDVRIHSLFAWVDDGLGLAAVVDLTRVGVDAEQVLTAAAGAVDGWEHAALRAVPVATGPTPGQVLSDPGRFSAALGAVVGVTGATSWVPLCFAGGDTWPAGL